MSLIFSHALLVIFATLHDQTAWAGRWDQRGRLDAGDEMPFPLVRSDDQSASPAEVEALALARGVRHLGEGCGCAGGPCAYCGTGFCCRKGSFAGGCDGSSGQETKYVCTIPPNATAPMNLGEECWNAAECRSGRCGYCGSGLCCRKGRAEGGCDGKAGGANQHECVAPCDADGAGEDECVALPDADRAQRYNEWRDWTQGLEGLSDNDIKEKLDDDQKMPWGAGVVKSVVREKLRDVKWLHEVYMKQERKSVQRKLNQYVSDRTGGIITDVPQPVVNAVIRHYKEQYKKNPDLASNWKGKLWAKTLAHW